jgi:hypothetical protein
MKQLIASGSNLETGMLVRVYDDGSVEHEQSVNLFEGGAGSGDHDHPGRPGKVGGSAPLGLDRKISDVYAKLNPRVGAKMEELVAKNVKATNFDGALYHAMHKGEHADNLKHGIDRFYNTDDKGAYGPGLYFASLKKEAANYGDAMFKVHVVAKLADMSSEQYMTLATTMQSAMRGHTKVDEVTETTNNYIADWFQSHGYDGMRVRDVGGRFATYSNGDYIVDFNAGKTLKNLESQADAPVVDLVVLWKRPSSLTESGTASSGDHGHAGRKGQVGGSLSSADQGLKDYIDMYVKLKELHPKMVLSPLIEKLLAGDGKFYTPQTLPSQYSKGTPKNCFQDAANLAMDHPDLTYVEGYATTGIIPVHHAWCADKDGKVIDPTWAALGDNDEGIEHRSYYGIPIPTDELTARIIKKKTWGFFETDYPVDEATLREVGTSSSGDRGHAGRKGKVGGSTPGSDSQDASSTREVPNFPGLKFVGSQKDADTFAEVVNKYVPEKIKEQITGKIMFLNDKFYWQVSDELKKHRLFLMSQNPAGVTVVAENAIYYRDTSPFTIIHELGHLYDLSLGGGKQYLSSQTGTLPYETYANITSNLESKETFVDQYASTGRDEFFAESFRAFTDAPVPEGTAPDWQVSKSKLKKSTPSMYKFFEDKAK